LWAATVDIPLDADELITSRLCIGFSLLGGSGEVVPSCFAPVKLQRLSAFLPLCPTPGTTDAIPLVTDILISSTYGVVSPLLGAGCEVVLSIWAPVERQSLKRAFWLCLCPRGGKGGQRGGHQGRAAKLYCLTPRDGAALETLRQLIEERCPSFVSLRQQPNPSSLSHEGLVLLRSSLGTFAIESTPLPPKLGHKPRYTRVPRGWRRFA
jgi:hypothetical protein